MISWIIVQHDFALQKYFAAGACTLSPPAPQYSNVPDKKTGENAINVMIYLIPLPVYKRIDNLAPVKNEIIRKEHVE